MIWPPPEEALQGQTLRLEPIAETHRDGLMAAGRDERIWEWMAVRSEADMAAWIDTAIAERAEGTRWAFVTVRDGEVIGSSSYLHIRAEHDGVEIGHTWLRPDVWRTGANHEAKLLMLNQCFDSLGCMRVEFKTDSRNARSRDALSGIGAEFEGIFRSHMNTPAGVRDSAYFSVTDADWPTVRERLRARASQEQQA